MQLFPHEFENSAGTRLDLIRSFCILSHGKRKIRPRFIGDGIMNVWVKREKKDLLKFMPRSRAWAVVEVIVTGNVDRKKGQLSNKWSILVFIQQHKLGYALFSQFDGLKLSFTKWLSQSFGWFVYQWLSIVDAAPKCNF